MEYDESENEIEVSSQAFSECKEKSLELELSSKQLEDEIKDEEEIERKIKIPTKRGKKSKLSGQNSL